MLTPGEIRKKADRLWSGGRVARAVVNGDDPFPLSIFWGRPGAGELSRDFPAVRKRITELRDNAGPEKMGYRIQWREINSKRLGRQRVPEKIVFDLDGFLRCTGRRREYNQLLADLQHIRSREPALEAWLAGHAMEVVRQAGKWEKLLAVTGWFKENPRPGLYLRQLDIPGVDTKFIEQHRKILSSLLDHLLPDTAINREVTGLAEHGFERRYNLQYDQPLVRLRYLDPAQAPHPACTDLALPLSAFEALDPPAGRVIITENKINGLSFPELADTVIIFGLGYGIRALAAVPWLREKEIRYWGDIDTHGFAILSTLRAFLPRTRSFLMDRATWQAHASLLVHEPVDKLCREQPANLTPEESALYEHLLAGAETGPTRLEQERIGFSWLLAAIRDRM